MSYIKCALDWDSGPSNLRDHYSRQIRSLPYNPEIRRMLTNIDNQVRDLSRAEVEARRLRRDISRLPELEKVNQAIETLEQYLIMGTLLS